jgi:hypothetical protein
VLTRSQKLKDNVVSLIFFATESFS